MKGPPLPPMSLFPCLWGGGGTHQARPMCKCQEMPYKEMLSKCQNTYQWRHCVAVLMSMWKMDQIILFPRTLSTRGVWVD